ncbi:MAG: hypothetical protein HUU06_02365, partial [Planctomycetaceae bacterium]|nr:hypothetical protein [Planctomycetaceae bacterium]
MRQEMTVKQGRNRDAERGIALLAVVAVLVLLTIIATPFLVTMKDGADRGKAVLASKEAELEAENVFQVTTLHLGASHDALERKNKDEKFQTLYATPDWDTLEEIQIPASVLSAAGGDPESGRIWGVTVEDESGKINVNNAPYTVLGHFFGMSLLAAPLDQDATEAELSYPGNLPARDGVVRLGDEVVKYDRLEGTTLRGLERGYMAGFAAGNGPARKHSQGEVVVSEVAFQISAYPILSRRGKVGDELRTWYSPYRNLYEIRRISDLRVAALPAEAWEKAADCLTVSSRGLTGQLWSDSQTLRTPVKAGEDGHKAKLHVDNPFRFGLGTVVRVTDGTNTDYGIVYGVGGGSRVEIVPEFQHDYDASITRVESLVRTPVNVNTASREVLTALHSGIGRHGQKPLAPDQARLVADRLIKEREAKLEDPLRGQKATAPGIRSLKQYGQILRKMVEEGVLQDEEATACELNSLNPADTAPGRLAVGSVPVAFRSCDVFTVTARAVVLDTAGRELGRREFRRVVDVAPQGPGVFELAGQADLDENLRVVNAKHFTTFPQNVDDEETGIYPPSRFNAFFRGDRWPSRDRLDQHASVRLAASRPIYGPEVPSAEHWDDSDYPEGYYMEEGEATPFGTQDGRVSIRTDDGLMEPFSGSLWFKPYWGGRRTAYVLDTGEAEDENRISLYYDGSRREMALRVKDASLQEVAAEIRYPFDQSSWEDDRWYHLQFSVSGSGPGEMSMLVDGMCRGKPTLLTYLSSSVDPVAPLTTLAVEDASSFPQSGALLIRGSNGTEVMEYSARSEKAFTIRKRFARLNRADTTDDPNQATTRAFDAGDLVTLYGYSIPTASAIPEGNGTLASALGPFTALCLVGPSDESGLAQFPNQAGGGTTGGGGTPTIPPVAFGWRGDTIQIPFDQIAPWGKSPGDQAASDALSDRGYALLACGDHRGALLAPDGERIFDAELVAYEKSGGSVTIRRRPEPTASLRSTGGSSSIDKKSGNLNLSFVPRHTYGAADDPMTAYVKLRNINNGRIYADEAFDEAGIVSVLIPLSIEVAGGDEDMFLDPERDATRRPRSHYVQIGVDGDTEWVRFDDAVQENSVSGNLLLVRDRSAYRTVSLFRTWIGEIAVTATPPGGGDPPGGGGDPPG